jgi:hypothetical protein
MTAVVPNSQKSKQPDFCTRTSVQPASFAARLIDCMSARLPRFPHEGRAAPSASFMTTDEQVFSCSQVHFRPFGSLGIVVTLPLSH